MSKYTAEDIIYLAGVSEDFKDKYVKMINELIESKLKERDEEFHSIIVGLSMLNGSHLMKRLSFLMNKYNPKS